MSNRIIEVEEGLLNHNSIPESKGLIQFEGNDSDESNYEGGQFQITKNFLKNLFEIDRRSTEIKLFEEEKPAEETISTGIDKVILKGWKNVENISARLIDSFDNTVVLECLIDKENGIYEEREFNNSLFVDYKKEFGSLFLLRIFERQNEVKLQIHNDPGLTLAEDFPKTDFVKKYSNSFLFKKE
jgi:hypothetical protein